MKLFALQTPLFKANEELCAFFCAALETEKLRLQEDSIVIIASKVVSVSQGRTITAAKKEMFDLVKKEAERSWETNVAGFYLTLKDGILIANAGIDASNAPQGKLILWPEDPQLFAEEFRVKLRKKFELRKIGVLIMDSRCTPLRSGVSGVALGWSGFEGVTSEIRKKDLYGKALEVTKNAVADNLASAAQLIIGSSDERTPFVICEEAPVQFTNIPQNPEMAKISREEDLFSVFWNGEKMKK